MTNHEYKTLEFSKKFFISTGFTENSNKVFYTLRAHCTSYIYTESIQIPVASSYHIKNLSIDYNKAVKKALTEHPNNVNITPEQDMNKWGEVSFDQEKLDYKKFKQEKASLAIFENFMTQYIELEYAQVVPVTEDRIQFEGKIIKTKWQDNDFGGSIKMLFEDTRGFKLWGTLPSKIENTYPTFDEVQGLKITFFATVQLSENDKSFGYFKRPTKVEIISEEIK
tara:strand:+ start:20 stop:691 length:672 start_codon:yes stop_codon:yes gene_type:complete